MITGIPEKSFLRGKSVIVCIGNVLKGDDGFGPLLAESLRDRTSLRVIDAGAAPENYLGMLIKENPDTVLFVDTADFGGEPGEAKVLRFEDFTDSSFFLTHNASLKLLREFVAAGGVSAEFYILCVQPQTMRFGEEPSAEVVKQAEKITDWFAANFPG